MENYTPKIFTNKAISIATFFGGPIAAGFLISKNFKTFGDQDAARKSVFIGILSTFLLFTILFLTPQHITDKIPRVLIPGIYTLIIAAIVEKYQGKMISTFLAENGKKASSWIAAGYGAIGLVIILVFVLILSTLAPFDGYEKNLKVDKNITMYYSENIDKKVSEQIAAAINKSEFLAESEDVSIFLNTENDFYRLRFILNDNSLITDSNVILDFNRFEHYLNYNLNLDRKIEVGFTDDNLVQKFELEEIEINDEAFRNPLLNLLKHCINNYHTIYYNKSVSANDLLKVTETVKKLKAYFPENEPIDIIFVKSSSEYTIKFFVRKELWNDGGVSFRLNSTVDYIKYKGIDKLNLVLIDNRTYEEKLL